METEKKIIKKIIEIIDKKHLSKIFDVPVEYKISSIESILGRHYIVTIDIDEKYFSEEPYNSKIGLWWVTLLRASDVYRQMNPNGSLNLQPRKISN